MQSQGLSTAPEDVHQLKGDAARAHFIRTFKEVQRLKTQLDQYTDLKPEQDEQPHGQSLHEHTSTTCGNPTPERRIPEATCP